MADNQKHQETNDDDVTCGCCDTPLAKLLYGSAYVVWVATQLAGPVFMGIGIGVTAVCIYNHFH